MPLTVLRSERKARRDFVAGLRMLMRTERLRDLSDVFGLLRRRYAALPNYNCNVLLGGVIKEEWASVRGGPGRTMYFFADENNASSAILSRHTVVHPRSELQHRYHRLLRIRCRQSPAIRGICRDAVRPQILRDSACILYLTRR